MVSGALLDLGRSRRICADPWKQASKHKKRSKKASREQTSSQNFRKIYYTLCVYKKRNIFSEIFSRRCLFRPYIIINNNTGKDIHRAAERESKKRHQQKIFRVKFFWRALCAVPNRMKPTLITLSTRKDEKGKSKSNLRIETNRMRENMRSGESWHGAGSAF